MPCCPGSTGMSTAELQDYGVGCAAHDINRTVCTTPLPAGCSGRFPATPECEVSTDWCNAAWCYVDADNCSLTSRNTNAPAIRGAAPLQLNLGREYSCESHVLDLGQLF